MDFEPSHSRSKKLSATFVTNKSGVSPPYKREPKNDYRRFVIECDTKESSCRRFGRRTRPSKTKEKFTEK